MQDLWSDCPKSPRIRYMPVEHEGFTYQCYTSKRKYGIIKKKR